MRQAANTKEMNSCSDFAADALASVARELISFSRAVRLTLGVPRQLATETWLQKFQSAEWHAEDVDLTLRRVTIASIARLATRPVHPVSSISRRVTSICECAPRQNAVTAQSKGHDL